MIGVALGLFLGVLLCAYAPWLPIWVRGRIEGVRPDGPKKPIEPVVAETPKPAEPLQPKQKQSVGVAKAASNLLGAIGGAIGWCFRNPLLAGVLIVASLWLLWMLMGSPLPFGLGKSRDLVNYEARLAEQQAQFADKFGLGRTEVTLEHERAVNAIANDLEQASEEVESQSHEDTLAMLRAWRDGASRLRQHADADGDPGA